jgi:hypothetical protein
MLLSFGDKAWPPPTPAVELPGHILVGAQLTPKAVEPAKGVCARQTTWTSNGACQIVRSDDGEAGFNLAISAQQACTVSAEAQPAEDRRWVFDERGKLRREYATNKSTAKSGGRVFTWTEDRIARVEHWRDFAATAATEIDLFVYDKHGNVIETSTQRAGASARRFLHVWYDKKIRMTTETGSGIAWSYEYKGKLLASVSERPGGILPVIEHRYSYDGKARMTAMEKRVGPVRVAYTGWTFDKQGRLASAAIDDQGRPQLNLEAPAKGAREKELVVIPQRADGQWDRVTRYYYKCDWISRNPPEKKAKKRKKANKRKPQHP